MGALEHGTPEGYARGCTTDTGCPAYAVHGMSCETAHIRHATGERRYEQLRGRGHTSTQIARQLGFVPGQGHPTPKETVMPTPTPAPKPAPPSKPLTVDPVIIPEAPKPTDAAQPLAERAQDPAPQEDAGTPAIEREAPAEGTPAAEGEAMGHHETLTPISTDRWTTGLGAAAKTRRLREIREWCRTNGHPDVPTKGKIPQGALATYAAAHPNEIDATPRPVKKTRRKLKSQPTSNDYTDILDEARDRATQVDAEVALPTEPEDEPRWAAFGNIFARPEQKSDYALIPPVGSITEYPGARPEWADITIPAEISHLRETIAQLEEELAEAERQRDAAQRSMILALRKWADMYAELEAIQRLMDASEALYQAIRASKYEIATMRRESASRGRRWRRNGRLQ